MVSRPLPATGTATPDPSSPDPIALVLAPSSARAILYYDGECGFCSRSVQYVLDRDRRGYVAFAPLQGETARLRLTEADRQRLSTAIVEMLSPTEYTAAADHEADAKATNAGRCYRRSAAVVRVLWLMGGVLALLGWLLWLVPLPLRDLGYVVVARFRKRLAPHGACRIPTPAERARFLG